jgi:hypothetical protein
MPFLYLVKDDEAHIIDFPPLRIAVSATSLNNQMQRAPKCMVLADFIST